MAPSWAGASGGASPTTSPSTRTANPDFSQVESDEGQFQFDPRNELFFSEKRPFFLDGIEQFTTPNSLIYTRRIVQPVAAAKLTGKGFGTDIALLSAVDDPGGLGDRRRPPDLQPPPAAAGRRRAVARSAWSTPTASSGSNYNRVAGVDGRILFGEVYSVQLQLAGSRTRTGGVTTTAPLWYARFVRNGRTFGFRATAQRERSGLPRAERLLLASRGCPTPTSIRG